MHDPYVSTYLGHRFYLTRLHIDDVAIEDIAHRLAYQCRFNGQTRDFYSVAQHSLMVMQLVPEEYRLAALLHDAAEAYLGDMVKPLKNMFPDFSEIETKVMAITQRQTQTSIGVVFQTSCAKAMSNAWRSSIIPTFHSGSAFNRLLLSRYHYRRRWRCGSRSRHRPL